MPNEWTKTNIGVKGTDKYANAHTEAAAIEIYRKRDREPFTLRTFCRITATQIEQQVRGNSVSLVWSWGGVWRSNK